MEAHQAARFCRNPGLRVRLLITAALGFGGLFGPHSALAAGSGRAPQSAKLNEAALWTPSVAGCTTCTSTNGGPVTVCPGETIVVTYKVTTSGSDNDWESTAYTIEGFPEICRNNGSADNHTTSGTFTEVFNITAPGSAGTYDLTLDAEDGNSCSAGAGGIMTLVNGIIVRSKAPDDDTCDGIDDDCDGKMDEDADDCMQCGDAVDACIYIMLDRTGSTSTASLNDEGDAANAFLDFFAGVADAPPVAIGAFGCNGSGFPANGSGHLGYCAGNANRACTLQALSDTETPAPYGDNDGSTSDGDHYSFVDFATASMSSVGTHFACALDVVNTELTHGSCPINKPKILIFLSDGGDQDGANSLTAADHLKDDHGVEIFSILFPAAAGGPSQAEQDQMEAIASDPKNTHYFLAPSSADLAGIFDTISEQIGCDDNNECTTDECEGNICANTPVANGTACDSDGVACTVDQCDGSGNCVHTPNHAACNDSNPCTNDTCTSGGCVYTNNSSSCNDNDPCTVNDVCSGGMCDGTPKNCSHLDTDCKVGECHPVTGVCQAVAANEGGPCNDGNACTDTDVCAGGNCAGSPVDCSAEDDQCNQGQCDPASGNCVKVPANEGSGCTDGNPCTVADVCVGGVCMGSPKDCSHLDDQCRQGVCVPLAGGCVAMAVNEGQPCNDGLHCNVGEVCIAGDCANGGARDCSDGVACTDDFCDEVNDVCVHSPNDAACPDPLAVCSDGSAPPCFCNGMEFCDPALGCRTTGPPCSLPTKCDEINDRCVICTTDAQCNDGQFCNGVETCDETTGFCVDGADIDCDDGIDCTVDACDEKNGCTRTPDNSQCPPDANTCTDEFCDPLNGCVSAPVPDGTFCGDSNDTDCDNRDTCVGGVCVPNYEPAGTPCFDDLNECTVDECDGFGNCTHDPVADDTPCDSDKNACTRDVCIAGACTHPNLPDGTACGTTTPKGPCDNPDQCIAGVCDRNLDPVGTICRTAVAICDVSESCTGTSEVCPKDGFQPSSFLCRAATGFCDLPDFCTGTGPKCPADAVIPAAPPTICRQSAGVCDVAEACDGINKNCPPDGFAPNSQVCRDSGGICDVIERCTGTGAACPPDAVIPANPPTTCRGPAGVCDRPETCDGTNKTCPPDGFLPNTQVCRAAAGDCDVAENCPGNGPNCPPDGFRPNTVVCRAVAGVCDLEERCPGTGPMCPGDSFQPSTVVCRPATNECDVEDRCPGSGANCTLDVCQAATVTCTDDGDRCTDDHCDGACACIHEDNNRCGACCMKDGSNECRDDMFIEECPHAELKFFPKQRCAELNCFDVLIPTVSEWGLVVLTLVLLVGAKVYFGRRTEQSA